MQQVRGLQPHLFAIRHPTVAGEATLGARMVGTGGLLFRISTLIPEIPDGKVSIKLNCLETFSRDGTDKIPLNSVVHVFTSSDVGPGCSLAYCTYSYWHYTDVSGCNATVD